MNQLQLAHVTLAPVAPNISAIALPMPRAPPVTIHTGASTKIATMAVSRNGQTKRKTTFRPAMPTCSLSRGLLCFHCSGAYGVCCPNGTCRSGLGPVSFYDTRLQTSMSLKRAGACMGFRSS